MDFSVSGYVGFSYKSVTMCIKPVLHPFRCGEAALCTQFHALFNGEAVEKFDKVLRIILLSCDGACGKCRFVDFSPEISCE